MKRRPEQVEINKDLIPNTNPSETIDNSVKEGSDTLTLSTETISSLNLLKSTLNRIFTRQTGSSETLTPAFIIVNYENQNAVSFKLFCDLGSAQSVIFEYGILNDDASETLMNLLTSKNEELTNLINGLNNFITSESIELLDIPSITPKSEMYYTTTVREELIPTNWNEETQQFEDSDEFFIFERIHFDQGSLKKEIYQILKSEAEKSELYNREDLNSIINIYVNNPACFESAGKVELGKDNLSLIFNSAKKTTQNENNFQQ
jgi:hypothetical protein